MNGIRIGVMGLAVATGLATLVFAGSLNPSYPTNNVGSAMYTLENIYQFMATGTTGAVLSAFSEPTAGPAGTMHTLNDIMGVVTNRSRVPQTGLTNSYAARDDGALQMGVAWPNPRFTVGTGANGTNCVTDNLTGLMWARNANLFAPTNWATAVTNCNNLNYGGYTDWRLPNAREFLSLLDFSQINAPPLPAGASVFNNVMAFQYYWTSTPSIREGPTANAYASNLNDVIIQVKLQTVAGYAWPVRGGRGP